MRRLLLTLALCLLTSIVHAAPHYTVTDIGAVGWMGHYGVNAVSDQGQVTGQINDKAFLWDNGKMTPFLGAFATGWGDDETPQASESHGNAVNNQGHVVGGTGGFAPIVMSGLYDCFPFLYINGDMQKLTSETADGPCDSFEAFGINDRDEIVGVHAHYGFYWSRGKCIEFGTLHNRQTGTWSSSRVNAINNKGQFVGESTVPGASSYQPYRHAVLWVGPKRGGHWKDLGVPAGFDNSTASALNNQGEVVGVAQVGYGKQQRAVIWKTGHMTLLPLFADATVSTAAGVNNQGDVVGGCNHHPEAAGLFNADAYDTAVLWRDNKAIDLNSLLPPSSDWTLNDARSINNRGWIVGTGTFHGQTHIFLLRPQ